MNACGYSKDSLQVYLWNKIGRTYARDSSFTEAIDYSRKAVHLIENNPENQAIDPHDLLVSFYDLYTYYESIGLEELKFAAIDSCLLYAAKMNYANRYSLYLLYYKIISLVNSGDYHQVLNYGRLGENISREILSGSDSLYYMLTFRDFQAEAFIAIGEFDHAENILAPIVERNGYYGSWYNLSSVYEHLAEVMAHKGDLKSAEKLFNLSLQNDLANKNFLQCSIIAGNIGLILYRRGKENANGAIRYYRKALSFVDLARSNAHDKDKGEITAETLNLLVNIANVKVSGKEFDSAFYYFQLAFDQLKAGSNETMILHSPGSEFDNYQKIGYVIELVIDKADALLSEFFYTGSKQSLSRAISGYKVADSIVNRVKLSQSDIQSRLFWRLDSRRLYENAIRACSFKAEVNEGYYFFERSRAVLLNDELISKEKSTEMELLKKGDLKRKILSLERKLENTGDSTRRSLESQLFTYRRELETIGHSTKRNNLSFLTHTDDSGATRVNQLQKGMLQIFEGIVEFFVGDSNVYVFSATRQHAEINRINRNEFVSLRDSYISFLDNPSMMNSHFNEFVKVARNLYQLIFGNTSIKPGRVVISPDGRNFPFESLVVSGVSEPVKYFVEEYAICYSYSSKYFTHDFEHQMSPAESDFLGMAPVIFPINTQLASLGGSDRSLEEVSRNFRNSNLLVGKEATRGAFMSEYSRYRIIHLYTHATDSSNRGEPVIYFSDSSLYLSELISENRPSTKLVMLAACETAGGKLYQGEGVFNFNRGFAALGVPSCITNLWSVDDESTYELTQSFYAYLSDGLPTDVALQKAKIDFLKNARGEKKLPSYWAASILAGKTEQFNINKGISRTTLAVIIGLPLAAIALLYVLVRRKKAINPSQNKAGIAA